MGPLILTSILYDAVYRGGGWLSLASKRVNTKQYVPVQYCVRCPIDPFDRAHTRHRIHDATIKRVFHRGTVDLASLTKTN